MFKTSLLLLNFCLYAYIISVKPKVKSVIQTPKFVYENNSVTLS